MSCTWIFCWLCERRSRVSRQIQSYLSSPFSLSSPLLWSPYQRSCLTLTAQLLMAHLRHREGNQTQGPLNDEPRKGQWRSIFLLFSYISPSFLCLSFFLSRCLCQVQRKRGREGERWSRWFSARFCSCRHIIHVNKWLLRSSRCSRRESGRDRAAGLKQISVCVWERALNRVYANVLCGQKYVDTWAFHKGHRFFATFGGGTFSRRSEGSYPKTFRASNTLFPALSWILHQHQIVPLLHQFMVELS